MTEKEYRESPGISRSELWRLNPRTGGTPEKFLYAKENPEPPTPAMVFGTLAHLALLEPSSFVERYTFAPEGIDRRTKAGKALWAEFVEAAGDRTVVTKDDWDTVCLMADKVNEIDLARKLLCGEHERVFRWTDETTGEECKIRVDSIRMVGGVPVIVDYKTTTDASFNAFARKCVNMGYDFQAGMYTEGVEIVSGMKPRFVFIVQETEPPFAVNILEADDEFIQRGRDLFRELLGIYHECKTTNNWYGYLGPEAVIGRLSLPPWAMSADN